VPAEFKDHFSHHSGNYARYRPTYPESLYEYLASLTAARELAVDVATGNGQAAVALSAHFDAVIGIDASRNQIESAAAGARITYKTASAENSGLDSACADLLTVAQAFHWFDAEGFFMEAARILKPEGVLAIWLYEITAVDRACDAVIDRLYTDIVGPFWPAERAMIEEGYVNVVLPGEVVLAPAFRMQAHWSVADMLGYLRTWSACRRYRERHGTDPVAIIEQSLSDAWGRGRRQVSWPMVLKVCRPNKPARM